MSLPHDEAGLRELEQKCESREAAASKRTVTRLQAKPPGYREGFIINCCIYGLANLVRCAIEASVSPNTRAAASKPAKNLPVLGLAAGEGHAHVVKLLLDNGADPLLYDDHDGTVLLHATQNGHEACVSLLIDAGADAMRADVVGNTPLSLPDAARAGRRERVSAAETDPFDWGDSSINRVVTPWFDPSSAQPGQPGRTRV